MNATVVGPISIINAFYLNNTTLRQDLEEDAYTTLSPEAPT